MAYTQKRRPVRVRQQAPGAQDCCPYGRAVAQQAKRRRKRQKLVHVGYGKFVVVDEEE